MLNFLFKGLVKKLERSAKEVSRDFVKSTGKEIGDLFDEKLYPLADKLDYIAKKRIKQAIDDTDKLENKIKVLHVWRWNNTWQSTVRVRAARHLL